MLNINQIDDEKQKNFVQAYAELERSNSAVQQKSKKIPISPSFQKYNEFFKALPAIDKNALLKKMREKGISYSEESTSLMREIELKSIKNSPNYEIVELTIRIGCYVTTLKVMSLTEQSKMHMDHQQGVGTFGVIYPFYFQERSLAIKCISFSQDQIQQTLQLALIEVCFLKIASALEIGPYFYRPHGFDLVIYNKCVQFCMEQCKNQIIEQNSQQQMSLMTSLYSFHLLNIVHRDIKPENIMFSPRLNKHVLIDYGLAQVIEEPMGYLTMSKFAGSISFCSSQIQQLCYTGDTAKVDLYFSDAQALRKVFQQNKKMNLMNYQTKISQQSYFNNEKGQYSASQDHFQLLRLKSLFYEHKYHQIKRSLNAKEKRIFQKFSHQLFDFLSEITASEAIKEIYLKHFQEKQFQKEQCQQLKWIYKQKGGLIPWNSGKLKENHHILKKRFNFQHKIFANFGSQGTYNSTTVRLIVLSEQRARKLQKQQYYKQFMYFIRGDISYCEATLQDKANAAKIFNKIANIFVQPSQNFNIQVEQDCMFLQLKRSIVYLIEDSVRPPLTKRKRVSQILLVHMLLLYDLCSSTELCGYLHKIFAVLETLPHKLFFIMSFQNNSFCISFCIDSRHYFVQKEVNDVIVKQINLIKQKIKQNPSLSFKAYEYYAKFNSQSNWKWKTEQQALRFIRMNYYQIKNNSELDIQDRDCITKYFIINVYDKNRCRYNHLNLISFLEKEEKISFQYWWPHQFQVFVYYSNYRNYLFAKQYQLKFTSILKIPSLAARYIICIRNNHIDADESNPLLEKMQDRLDLFLRLSSSSRIFARCQAFRVIRDLYYKANYKMYCSNEWTLFRQKVKQHFIQACKKFADGTQRFWKGSMPIYIIVITFLAYQNEFDMINAINQTQKQEIKQYMCTKPETDTQEIRNVIYSIFLDSAAGRIAFAKLQRTKAISLFSNALKTLEDLKIYDETTYFYLFMFLSGQYQCRYRFKDYYRSLNSQQIKENSNFVKYIPMILEHYTPFLYFECKDSKFLLIETLKDLQKCQMWSLWWQMLEEVSAFVLRARALGFLQIYCDVIQRYFKSQSRNEAIKRQVLSKIKQKWKSALLVIPWIYFLQKYTAFISKTVLYRIALKIEQLPYYCKQYLLPEYMKMHNLMGNSAKYRPSFEIDSMQEQKKFFILKMMKNKKQN